MAWFKLTASTEPFAFRFPVAVDNTAGGTANADVRITIPETLDDFWQNIDASGYQIRVTDSDGITEVSYKWNSFTAASRTGILDIVGASGTTTWSAQASSVPLLWVYVGDSNAGDDQDATAPAGAVLAGTISAEAPAGTIVVGQPAPGRSEPANRRSQTSTERKAYWFDFSKVLRGTVRKYNSRANFEEIDYVEVSSVSAGSGASIEVEADTRYVGNRGMYVRVTVTGGSDATDYTVIVKATTKIPDDTVYQVAEGRLLILVRDADDN
jgi:hypothetical protein